METGKRIAIGGTVVLVLVAAARVGMIYRERHEAAKPVVTTEAKVDPDDNVFLRKLHPDSLKDEKDLAGKTLWVAAGGVVRYYAYPDANSDHGVDGTKAGDVLLGGEPLAIKDAIEHAAPKGQSSRIPAGDKQVMLLFTLPASADPDSEYVVPVGYREGGSYTFSTDDIFFYEDPHKLYSHWSAAQWAAIDAHKVVPGMSERQAALALGQISTSHSQDYGNRTVHFDHQGHPVDVTFVNNRATVIRPQ